MAEANRQGGRIPGSFVVSKAKAVPTLDPVLRENGGEGGASHATARHRFQLCAVRKSVFKERPPTALPATVVVGSRGQSGGMGARHS